MGHLDDRTQEQLLDALFEASRGEQAEILERLAAIGEAEALDAIIDFLRDASPEEDNRVAALAALRVLANKYMPASRYSLAEALIPFLTSEDWAERLAAARLLNTHPNELAVEPLHDLVDDARQRTFEERHNRFSPRRLLAERTLWESVLAMANCGRLTVLPTIKEFLEDATMRPIAARSLGIIGSETERDDLEELAEDPDYRVRDSAQWALGLMDERAAQFMLPPDQMPPPPPDRLSSLYWAHRQLEASDHEIEQFLVVRVAIEHLVLDGFLADGRNPADCEIILKRFEGETPPNHTENDAPIVGVWDYYWQGPSLVEKDEPTTEIDPNAGRSRLPGSRPGTKRSSTITISYPAMLHFNGEGTVSIDCSFSSYFAGGWVYHITLGEGGWIFSRGEQTWSG